MAIREDLVASAAQFLQDPNVASSSIENRVSFLRSKNLTQEEIDVALSRVGAGPPPPAAPYPAASSGYPQQYYQPYPQNAWQPPPPVPRRDWRDWFIMATVASGVSYGLYTLGKRYVYPLVAPPTPERLEQDKKSIEDQFDRAFSLVEQLAKDTEKLKEAEQERSKRLDATIVEMETVISDLKLANRRRDDDSQRLRDEINVLKGLIPKAIDSQKDATDSRLREINTELTSLKTLVSQRVGSAPAPASSSNFRRPTISSPATPSAEVTPDTASAEPSKTSAPKAGASPGIGRTLGMNGGSAKASIPAWQMAMANKTNDTPATSSSSNETENQEATAGASSS
ncbi:peroxisomal membrane anchor protein conserved region-domain-containing protein [Stachybotrys elegans]|uniref:Peroxisomal membrane protein PEX14 n=1 Tax=Stachybotrys elegans TaxID=80388 RepID=A0A8K0SM38_9HYPO|nr:peroxisomal membrane anchor protein conserved region-domain-containing protein [Stachybotrys elegans]